MRKVRFSNLGLAARGKKEGKRTGRVNLPALRLRLLPLLSPGAFRLLRRRVQKRKDVVARSLGARLLLRLAIRYLSRRDEALDKVLGEE